MNFCIKISCSTYVLAHFSGCPWYLSFFLLTLPALSELGNSENLSFLPKKAPEFFQNLSFLGDLSFQSAQKKSLNYRTMELHVLFSEKPIVYIWCHQYQIKYYLVGSTYFKSTFGAQCLLKFYFMPK